jgi:putative transcriptional regulator
MKRTDKSTGAAKRDWSRLDAMTAAEKHAAALSDPDNRPLTEADMKRMKRTPQVKVIRRALGISQEDFAARYHIPIGTLRDWEQGRVEPDQAARAYLTVIARDPEAVRKALSPAPRL